jgi:hypothetical protein
MPRFYKTPPKDEQKQDSTEVGALWDKELKEQLIQHINAALVHWDNLLDYSEKEFESIERLKLALQTLLRFLKKNRSDTAFILTINLPRLLVLLQEEQKVFKSSEYFWVQEIAAAIAMLLIFYFLYNGWQYSKTGV